MFCRLFSETPNFINAAKVSSELATWYEQLAEMYGCEFLDASKIVSPSPADGVHIDVEAHKKLGKAIYEKLHESNIIE